MRLRFKKLWPLISLLLFGPAAVLDVPPKAILKGPSTMLIAPRGAVLNLKDQEMYVIDKVQNGFFAYALERIMR